MDDTKVPEPTSPSGDSQSTKPRTLSPDEQVFFDDLFRALDCLVLERSTEGQAFRTIHTVPEWAHYLITTDPNQPSQDLYIPRSGDIKDYMAHAMPWWDQHEGGASESKLWEEDGPTEDGLDLEAAAIAIGHRKLLVIKRGAPSRRAYIQLMRERRLNL